MPYNVLALNPGHNGSVALVSDGELVYFVEEERLTREKYDSWPMMGILDIVSRWKVDKIVIGGTLLNDDDKTPWSNKNPYKAMVDKVVNKRGEKPETILFGSEHHLGHAACAFYNSGFDTAISIVVDGSGSIKSEMCLDGKTRSGFETESIFRFEYPSKVTAIKKLYTENYVEKYIDPRMEFDDAVSITKAYEAVTDYLGFSFIEAGKTMGLASYGKHDPNIPPLFVNGRGNKNVFRGTFPCGAHVDVNRWPYLCRDRDPKEWHKDPSKLYDIEKDIAWEIQDQTQKLVGDMIEWVVKTTGEKNICLSGGYGLNCVTNYYLKKRFPDINLFCEPISHDGGTAIGLAKYVYYSSIVEGQEYKKFPHETIYYGPTHNPQYIEAVVKSNLDKFDLTRVTYDDVAKLIADKNIVAMYQGRSEAGPRALGNRSILYDPRDVNGKDFVNVVKGREWFRPFAGSIMEEFANDWFDMAGLESSPFMMYAVDVLKDKMEEIPCITHVDGTCRIQTVNTKQNLHYYNLIEAFNKITGVPILFNTSFNLAGDPLVETIDDALQTLLRSKMEYLYLPEFEALIKKK